MMRDDIGYFGPSRPRRTRGGIRAQTQRGGFARSWWGRRWIEVLEGLDIGGRLSRGRSYARGGQVSSIDIGKGIVAAVVQGSRPEPYRVAIRIRRLTAEEWEAASRSLAARAVFAAKLLAGEMPEGIEEAFSEAGVSLFPTRIDDLRTSCTCPDAANPCKHIAAVYYLLGEEFDRDPFLIFRLRGRTRDELSSLIRPGEPPASPTAGSTVETRTPEGRQRSARPAVDLPAAAEAFWGDPTGVAGRFPDAVRIPPVSAALVKRLGSFPFWRGERTFIPLMEKIYAAASPIAISIFIGEPEVDSAAMPDRSPSGSDRSSPR